MNIIIAIIYFFIRYCSLWWLTLFATKVNNINNNNNITINEDTIKCLKKWVNMFAKAKGV